MIRKPTAERTADAVTTELAPPAAPIVNELPAQGGSYVRDPATGKLARVEGPKEA